MGLRLLIKRNYKFELIDRANIIEEMNQVKRPGIWFYLYIGNKKYSVICLTAMYDEDYYKKFLNGKKWEAWESGTDVDNIKRYGSLYEMIKNSQ